MAYSEIVRPDGAWVANRNTTVDHVVCQDCVIKAGQL